MILLGGFSIPRSMHIFCQLSNLVGSPKYASNSVTINLPWAFRYALLLGLRFDDMARRAKFSNTSVEARSPGILIAFGVAVMLIWSLTLPQCRAAPNSFQEDSNKAVCCGPVLCSLSYSISAFSKLCFTSFWIRDWEILVVVGLGKVIKHWKLHASGYWPYRPCC